MALRQVFIVEGEARGTAIDQGVCILASGDVFNSALDDRVVAIKLRY